MPADRVAEMFAELANARPEVQPSKYWLELNAKNLSQLEEFGYDNFKVTIALNYFTWIVSLRDSQIRHLLKHLSPVTTLQLAIRSAHLKKHQYFSKRLSFNYNFLTYMLWQYALDHDHEHLADKLCEPQEGNPPHVPFRGKLISQDLANSLLEFKSIREGIPDPGAMTRIIELGAGYGRNAYVFLKLLPDVKYVIVDIPPALYISERYLSSQFSDRKIFRFRPFDTYLQIKEELETADIAFLLPHQLDLLPDRFANLFINISSLHEMRQDQIDYYFLLIDRLTENYFYMKQWKISHIPFDNIVIREHDYPVPEGWTRIYSRQCAVQTEFFEALFSMGAYDPGLGSDGRSNFLTL